jgi:transcriptional antiterminator
MPLFTEAEKRKLLLGSVDSGAKTRTYTALLGFRQLSQSRLKTGSRKFTGLVGEFDIATRRLVHKLATEYKSCKELKETLTISPNFIHQDVEDRLSEFGSRIWNSRYPFVTITDNEKGDHKSYMRYLDYAEDDDRAR